MSTNGISPVSISGGYHFPDNSSKNPRIQTLEHRLQQLNQEKQKAVQQNDKEKEEKLKKEIEQIRQQIEQLKRQDKQKQKMEKDKNQAKPSGQIMGGYESSPQLPGSGENINLYT